MYSRCSGDRGPTFPLYISSANPMMAFNGVRSSWDMLARNSVLRRLASSIRHSSCLRSVMSRIALDTSVPPSVFSGLRLISIGNSVPSFRNPNSSSPMPIPRGRGSAEEPGAVPRMGSAKAIGNEDLDPLPDEFLPGVSEEPLRLGVDQHDAPVLVDDDHGVRSGLQQVLESFLRLLAIADVTDRGGDERLIFGVEGTQADFNRKLRPVLAQAGELQAGPHRPDARFREEIGSVCRNALHGCVPG